MTDELLNNSWDTAWFDQMALRIEQQRQRADQLLCESERQMRQFESHVSDQLRSASEEFAQTKEQLSQRAERLVRQEQAGDQARDHETRITSLLDQVEHAFRDHQQTGETVSSESDSEWRRRYEELSAEANEVAAMREQLEKALQEVEHANHDAEPSDYDRQDFVDLQQRFELAVADIRELKEEKSKLQDRLGELKGVDTSGALNWEAEKNRMMMQLEQELVTNDSTQDEDRLTVEGTIRITDQVVAEKDKELEELRLLLEQQSGNIGGMAVGAAAIAEMFDQDELICEEREKAKALEGQWKEKLRQAEIDISLERAKLARDRLELEENAQQNESKNRTYRGGTDNDIPESAPAKKKSGWFSQLGFSRDEEG